VALRANGQMRIISAFSKKKDIQNTATGFNIFIENSRHLEQMTKHEYSVHFQKKRKNVGTGINIFTEHSRNLEQKAKR
jgi:hypothetical protein